MEYLTLFNNFDEFGTFIDEKNFEVPCVGYVQDENYVHYFKDYEALPTILNLDESYPKLVAFFKKILAELDLDFDTNEFYTIDLHATHSVYNEIDVTDYEWYNYLLNLQKGRIDSDTGEFITSPVTWIRLFKDKVSMNNNFLDFTTNSFYQVPI
jgi:hypothetical protein